jgi:glucuronoarabinoxylan endo-1,4-beta-xylanase
MKRIITSIIAIAAATAIQAATITIKVTDTRRQTITGFGAACCDGAMRPYGTDTNPVKLLYGKQSAIGLNIMRMEISPNFKGNITAADVGWETPYDWAGSVPSAKIVKQRGGIVFGTPWSPPGAFKTNGISGGGNSENQGYKRGELRQDCYEKFFPWLNLFLSYMNDTAKVHVDAVSVQNEPDWWVSYSGCLYTPEQQLNLVKNYAHMLDREKYNVRLISAEPLGFDQRYSDMLLNDETAREQIDIVAGHIYGHAPLTYIKNAAVLAEQYGKEVWMTEHSSTDNIGNRLPNWHEQLLFAEELNECMLSGCTGYIYWYMRAHWAFVGTGESQYGSENVKNKLLPRAYVMSHFSKHVTGSTRLEVSHNMAIKTEAAFETSAYIKGDSIIVMAIDTTKNAHQLKLQLPVKVESGTHLLSTGNETENLLQQLTIDIAEPTNVITVDMPARSLNTYIFMIDKSTTGVKELKLSENSNDKTYYDLHGRRLDTPHGLCIEKRADGSSSKIFIKGPRKR